MSAIIERVRYLLPRGGSLPVERWQRRHRGILALLWLNVLVLPAYRLASGETDVKRILTAVAAVAVFAALGASPRLSRTLRSVAVSLGLLTAAALFVAAAHGRIEAHFYFFVLIIVLTLYEDWLPFLAAVAFVLVHHGVLGTIDPHAVFDRPEEWAHPWKWAAIHAAFVAAAGAAAIGAWRLNEDVRSEMRAANRRLEEVSETDNLTGLGNRRKLMADLPPLLACGEPVVLVILDLDGFKTYNDTFGHPAGDSLLVRLAGSLRDATAGHAHAYRLGGDEFCVVWLNAGASERIRVEEIAAAAMSEHGEGFSVTASYGSVAAPEEAASIEDALRAADMRMYTRKHGSRPSSRRQSGNVLIQALAERHPDLGPHLDAVTALAGDVATRLGLAANIVEHVRLAAGLHDIGKVAIPDEIVGKPGPLDEAEWEFMRRHTIIGERILRAAPALFEVARLVRSSHERYDGTGYPDGLAGDDIPVGARIICVCDAYDAMTSERPYRQARSPAEALAEVRRCAGSQFDPEIVAAFAAVLEPFSAGPAPAPVAAPVSA
ncbi:MAG TPA: diguanylate cyclase [Solirubrobacteraceae bacterium]|nr:diguanylate cyclase [Solirubrobacteraceae bacterium]